MTQFVLVQNFFSDDRLETTLVLGVFASLTDAQAHANQACEEIREDLEWKDEAPKWVWDENMRQWSTTDVPPEDVYHRYIIQIL